MRYMSAIGHSGSDIQIRGENHYFALIDWVSNLDMI